MSKLTGEILWFDDSSAYGAKKSFYPTPDTFVTALRKHISRSISRHEETECGWYVMPDVKIEQVKTAWLVHRIQSYDSDTPCWELVEEPGRGHVPIWYLDFEEARESNERTYW